MPTSLIPRFTPGLSPLDLALVALYLVAITLFGLRFSRSVRNTSQDKSLKSYFLANNTIPWWAIALSIVSAETSTLTIISIPGVAFGGDFGFLQIVLGYMLGRIVVAVLFLPRYFRGELLTAYQLIDRRFGATLHKLTAGLFLFTRAAAEGVRVFAISIVVGIAIGTGNTLSIGIISALTLLYTFEGGLAAVIWTDVVQMGLYLAGTLVALWTLGAHVPGGWTYIHLVGAQSAKFHMLDFTLSLAKSYTFWAGILGGTFLTMASHGTDQLMVQRMLAARNLRESRLALLSSGAVIFLQFTLFLLIGVGLFVFYGAHPHVFSSPDRIFPTFIVHEMPHGVAGLLVAAILAAAMSNLSAALNSLASTTVVDFYVPWHARRQERSNSLALPKTTLVSRAATIFWAVVLFAIAVYAIQHGGKGHVVETGLSIASVAYGCLLGVFLLGTLTRYATQTGAIAGMLCGLAVNLALWLFPAGNIVFHPASPHPTTLSMPHIAFTWYVLIGSLITFAVGSLFSLLLPRKRVVRTLQGAALLLIALSAISGATSSAQVAKGGVASTPRPRGDFTAVSTIITSAIAAHKLPGAVVLVGHDNQIVFHQAYGNRAVEPSVEPMTEDTIFDMASLTKVLVTTTAVLQLYEQGKLDLDAPVARYLPAFAANGKDKITIRELLTHYSGLPEDIDLKDPWGLAAPDKAEGIRRAMQAVPYGPHGVTFKYSDINFIALGALVETLTSEELWKYASRSIFRPLHMVETSYRPFINVCATEPIEAVLHQRGLPTLAQIEHDIACGRWAHLDLIAPTAHDGEGTPATNPNFDHLLRGTVHDPTTRRMGGVAGHAGVFSTAEDMSIFCQALLDKLLRNTGPFPLTQATLRLATTPQQPLTAAATATIFTPSGETTKGVAARGLGWDLNSPFSRPRGELFPITTREHPGSFGHTGFTGTSLWLDPASNTYVILLANAIHPRGGPPISALRGEVATAAARALNLYENATTSSAPGLASQTSVPNQAQPLPTLTGIDVLEATHFAALKSLAPAHNDHLKIALLTNQSGIDAQGRRTIDVLLHADPSLQLTTLFSPEHGLYGKQDTEHLATEQDVLTHLSVISLYGPKPANKRPKAADLAGFDAVVIDLQDVGVRFWTYETLLGYLLEATACTQTEIIVLDRPNPIGGLAIQGPLSDPAPDVYTNYMPLPVRHGLTLGELAQYFRATHPCASQATNGNRLHVIAMQNWRGTDFFDDTHLPWTPPSPNMRTSKTAVLYPAVGLVEQTNVSVGRGTATPFEDIGAPYLHAPELAAYLTARHIPGIAFTPTTLTIAETPERYPSHGQTIPGIHLEVTDRDALDSPELGIELLAALNHLYPKDFQLDRAHTLLANAATLAALKAGSDPRAIAATWQASLHAFRLQTDPYRLYPEPPAR